MQLTQYFVIICLLNYSSKSNLATGKNFAPRELDENHKITEEAFLALLERMSSKIVGGFKVREGDLPNQLNVKVKGKFKCGATLAIIQEEQIALTAAHCVCGHAEGRHANPEDILIIGGDFSLSHVSKNEQSRYVRDVRCHEGYEMTSIANDIAIIFLESPFHINKYVAPLLLPQGDWEVPAEVFLSGWGSMGAEFPPSNYLRIVRLPVVSNEECKEIFAESPGYSDDQLCSGQLGEGGKGSCFGDDGGPATGLNTTVTGDGLPYLVGLISYSGIQQDCHHSWYPSVQIKVTTFMDWIESTVADQLQQSP